MWTQLLEQLGIADVNAFINLVIATSKTGPQFKAAATQATTALTALSEAALNPQQ
jgi:hypothetical protein